MSPLHPGLPDPPGFAFLRAWRKGRIGVKSSQSLESVLIPLRLTIGILSVIFGLDAFTNFLTDWWRYVSPTLVGALDADPSHIMYWVGPLEILVGALVLRWARRGAIALGIWLSVVVLNLIMGGILDMALLVAGQAVGAFTLARLTGRKGEDEVPLVQPGGVAHYGVNSSG